MKVLKMLFVFIFSLTTYFSQTVNVGACSGEPSLDSHRVWLFQPDLPQVTGLRPFIFAGTIYYDGFDDKYGFSNSAAVDTAHYELNIREWQQVAGASATAADVRKVLYHLDAPRFFRQLPDTLRNNTFIAALKRPANKALMDYLLLSKKIEGALNKKDEWGTTSADFDEAKTILPEAKAQLDKASTPFLKLRTAYQMMRLNPDPAANQRIYDTYIANIQTDSWIKSSAFFYTVVTPDATVRDVWETQSWNMEDGTIKPKTVAQINSIARANLRLSKVFTTSLDKRYRVMQLFDRQYLPQTLALAQTNADKATLYAMTGLRDPGRSLTTLQNIYRLDPQNAPLKLLLAREINKIEDQLWTSKLTGNAESFWDSIVQYRNANPSYTSKQMIDLGKSLYLMRNRVNDLAYLKQVADFAAQVISEDKQPDKAFWLLSGAYLSLMNKDAAKAQTLLAQAKGVANVSPEMQLQIALTDLMATVFAEPKISAATEQKIVDFVRLLDQNKANLSNPKTFRSQVMLFLAGKYLEERNVTKATLLYAKSDQDFSGLFKREDQFASENPYHVMLNLARPKDYDSFTSFLQKSNKTPFEQFLTGMPRPYNYSSYSHTYDPKTNEYEYSEWVQKKDSEDYEEVKRRIKAEWDFNKLKDYKSMYYVRRDQLDSAYTVLQTIPEGYWATATPYSETLDHDPFFVDTRSPRLHTGKIYSKTAFVGKILQLKAEIARDPSKKAMNEYLLGNAYYNMSWHGNFWIMSHVYRSVGDMFVDGKDIANRAANDAFNSHYLGATRAKSYYKLAMQHSQKDATLAQLAAFMADYCDQHWQEYQANLAGKGDSFRPTKRSNLLALRQVTSNTQAYDQLSRDCTGYGDFIDKYRMR